MDVYVNKSLFTLPSPPTPRHPLPTTHTPLHLQETAVPELFCLAMVTLDFIARHEAVRPHDEEAYVLEVSTYPTYLPYPTLPTLPTSIPTYLPTHPAYLPTHLYIGQTPALLGAGNSHPPTNQSYLPTIGETAALVGAAARAAQRPLRLAGLDRRAVGVKKVSCPTHRCVVPCLVPCLLKGGGLQGPVCAHRCIVPCLSKGDGLSSLTQ